MIESGRPGDPGKLELAGKLHDRNWVC
jgi:hypothetical protein